MSREPVFTRAVSQSLHSVRRALDSVRNYLLGFRRISEVDISVQKKRGFPQKIGIPALGDPDERIQLAVCQQAVLPFMTPHQVLPLGSVTLYSFGADRLHRNG